MLERLQRLVGQVLDRAELRDQLVVEVTALQSGRGEPGDGGDRRAESVLVSLDLVDT